MPDHCHFLIRGKNKDSDMKKMILAFKQITGYWMSKNLQDTVWQKNFFDHLLRSDDDINKHINYILLNPVRKQLTENWHDYPFKGSTVFDLEAWEKDSLQHSMHIARATTGVPYNIRIVDHVVTHSSISGYNESAEVVSTERIQGVRLEPVAE